MPVWVWRTPSGGRGARAAHALRVRLRAKEAHGGSQPFGERERAPNPRERGAAVRRAPGLWRIHRSCRRGRGPAATQSCAQDRAAILRARAKHRIEIGTAVGTGHALVRTLISLILILWNFGTFTVMELLDLPSIVVALVVVLCGGYLHWRWSRTLPCIEHPLRRADNPGS